MSKIYFFRKKKYKKAKINFSKKIKLKESELENFKKEIKALDWVDYYN